MTKLSQEDKELIAGMLSSGEWKVVEKVCQMQLEAMQIEVINASIDNGSREIVLRKSRLDGARKLATRFANIKHELKKEGLNG